MARGVDEPTNVLSFRQRRGRVRPLPQLLGDVVAGFETVRREAAAQGKTLADHLRHLVVHGVLHLLGYDHWRMPRPSAWRRSRPGVLAGLGIADPYAEREGAHG